MDFRTLVALTGTLVCAALAHAASDVETAREQQAAPFPASIDEVGGAAAESALAEVLAGERAPLQIQLGAADPGPRPVRPLDLPLEDFSD